MPQPDLENVETQLNSAIQGNQQLGEINPRNPGLHNDLVQIGKKLVRRSLTWYTRPLQVFQVSILEALQGILSVLKSHDEALQMLARESSQRADIIRPGHAAPGTGILAVEAGGIVPSESQSPAVPQVSGVVENILLTEPDRPLIGKEEFLPQFRDVCLREMVGWVNPDFLSIVQYCDQLHHELCEKGGAVEIGVHHGKFFISLNLFCDADEPSLAIDVFQSQHLNIDKSGAGDLPTFVANLREYCRHRGKNVTIMAADSTTLSPSAIVSAIKMKPRFFSIDGGHTAEHTINDLNLAKECLSPGGVIFVDDILNHHWLGVVEGVGKFLSLSPTIVPFAVGFNKLMLCRLSYHEFFLERFRQYPRVQKELSFYGKTLLAV